MKLIYKLFLALNSTILLLVIYLIKEHITLPISFFRCEHISYLIYILMVFLFSRMCLWSTCFLSAEIIEGGIVEIESANNSYLPSYLGYFFVALGINDWATWIWTFLILFIFTINSQTCFFNPMFLLFGYKFYYVTMENGMKVFVITKQNIRTVKNLKFNQIVRINDYTYIDRGGMRR